MTKTPDPTVCPECGGPTDHDREFPPNPYVCDKCNPDPRTPDPTPVSEIPYDYEVEEMKLTSAALRKQPSEQAKRIAEAVHDDLLINNSTVEVVAESLSENGLAELEAERDGLQQRYEIVKEAGLSLGERCADLEARLAAAEQDANQVKADYNLLHNASRDVYFYACDGLHITDERDVLCFARLNVILKGGERGHNPEVCVDVQEAYDKMKRERDEARGRLERIAQLVHGDGWHGLNAVTQDKVYRLATATDEGGSDESTKS